MPSIRRAIVSAAQRPMPGAAPSCSSSWTGRTCSLTRAGRESRGWSSAAGLPQRTQAGPPPLHKSGISDLANVTSDLDPLQHYADDALVLVDLSSRTRYVGRSCVLARTARGVQARAYHIEGPYRRDARADDDVSACELAVSVLRQGAAWL